MDKLTLKKLGRLLLGIALLPVLLVVYFIDRFIWVVLCMGNGPTIVEYFNDFNYIGYSMMRCAMLITFLYLLSWVM